MSDVEAVGTRMVRWMAALICAVAMAGCDRPPEVVVYVSADDFVAREVIAAFEDTHDVRVRMVGDTEAKKTTGLVERLRSERDAPVADVFWSSEIFQTIGLADEGILASCEPAAAADRPASQRDPDGRWFAFAARARVIAYAPDRVDPDDVPQAWTDLARDRWRGRVVMADPRFGTTGGHLGAMRAYWAGQGIAGYYEAWLLGLRDAEVRLLPSGNAGAVRAIIDGEADLAMTDTDDVWAARAAGHEVGMVYPWHSLERRSGDGTLLIPNTVALVSGAPNPDAAMTFIEFMLSPAVERLLAESDSRNVPMHPDLADELTTTWADLAVPSPLEVSFARAAAQRDPAITLAMRLLAGDVDASDWPDAVGAPSGDDVDRDGTEGTAPETDDGEDRDGAPASGDGADLGARPSAGADARDRVTTERMRPLERLAG